jgi:hypothetical protein
VLFCWNVVCDHTSERRFDGLCCKRCHEKVMTAMAGKGRQMPRKPATKFAHLRKKMEKNRIVSKIGKKKRRQCRLNAKIT